MKKLFLFLSIFFVYDTILLSYRSDCLLIKKSFAECSELSTIQPTIISLGFNCQVAYQISQYGFRKASFPFDWIRCSFASLCRLLSNDFKDFLNHEYLVLDPTRHYVLNTQYNLEFWHDFPHDEHYLIQPTWQEDLENIQQKYSRRINRLYQVLNDSGPVFLIYARTLDNFEGPLSIHDAIILKEILAKKFTNKNWSLIVLDDSEQIKESWNIENVINLYLKHSGYNNILGYNEYWKPIFEHLGLLKND